MWNNNIFVKFNNVKKSDFFWLFKHFWIYLFEKNFYSYKNIMPENEQNLEETVGTVDLSAVSLQPESSDGMNADNVVTATNNLWTINSVDNVEFSQPDMSNIDFDTGEQTSSTIDESVFLDTWDMAKITSSSSDSEEHFWKYLRLFFFSSFVTIIWIIWIVLVYSFNNYITWGSQTTSDFDKQEYVNKYKPKLEKVKGRFWMNNKANYQSQLPVVNSPTALQRTNDIINATDIDYIDKKDLLSNYAADIVRNAQDRAVYVDSLKQEIAKQWFLPDELNTLLTDNGAIDTIQRSLNALEVIKFSTATKVFSYMNTALTTIAEMMRISGSNIENLKQLFLQLWSRWEKDITAYVYMCYLNPFETNADCDTIWDLDLYYSNKLRDGSINIKLFKNSMNAISQLLEKGDTTLFSITFNWFNAQDKNITFSIEVYTNQDDERSLMAQWKRNPNIFILTNIINLLKQSSFIIWAEINTKEVNVEAITQNLWNISRKVNYSTMDFTVPIQKDTEREIFDYIDLDSIKEFLDRINAKYDEEDLSNDVVEASVPIEDEYDPFNESYADIEMGWEWQSTYDETNSESGEIEENNEEANNEESENNI